MKLIEYQMQLDYTQNNTVKNMNQALIEKIAKIESDPRKSYLQRETEIALRVILYLQNIELAECFLYWRYMGIIGKDYFTGLDSKGNEVLGISIE
jgi:hypothetical protein